MALPYGYKREALPKVTSTVRPLVTSVSSPLYIDMRAAGHSTDRQGGWTAALEQFRAGLQQYLAQRLHHAQNAEELAQEVYLRLLRVESPQRVKSPQAYMYRVAVNALQEFRAREASSPVAFDSERVAQIGEHLSDDSATPETLIDRHTEGRELEKLVAQLPPMQRRVLLMATSQDLPHAQIASTLGISVRTVRNHLYRALHACRQQLSARDR